MSDSDHDRVSPQKRGRGNPEYADESSEEEARPSPPKKKRPMMGSQLKAQQAAAKPEVIYKDDIEDDEESDEEEVEDSESDWSVSYPPLYFFPFPQFVSHMGWLHGRQGARLGQGFQTSCG